MKYRIRLLVKNENVTSKSDFSLSRRLSVLVFLLLLIFSPMLARAQQQTDIKEGDRIRLDVPSMQKRPIVGTIGEISDYGLVLHGADSTYFIPHSSIHTLSVSTGKRRNIGKGAIIGLLGGASIGGIVGLMSYEECNEEGLMACFLHPENEGQAFALGAIVGFIPGTLIGAAIGSAKTDRWEKVPSRMLLNMKPVGTLQPTVKPQITLRWSIGSRR